MSLKIYLLRHGQTECSRDNVFCGSGLDPGLTEDGQAMAQAFAATYAAMTWSGIYCSPLTRTRQTAQSLQQATGQQVQLRDELKEIGYGQWEGLTADAVAVQFHDDYISWSADPAWNAPTGGERAVAIAERGLRIVEEVRSSHQDGNVLLVSHKATIRIILCALLGIDPGRFRFRLDCPVASLSIVEWTRHGPLLLTLADRSHLPRELRELPGT